MKIVIFGAGTCGMNYIKNCPADEEITAISDNNWGNWKNKTLYGYKVIPPEEIRFLEYDRVVITISSKSEPYQNFCFNVFNQLTSLGIPNEKIILMANERESSIVVKDARIEFLRLIAYELNKKCSDGNVAECGVLWGDFSANINKFFPTRTLYLFDTFSGFDARDFEKEPGKYDEAIQAKDALAQANPRIALLKCVNKERVIVKKGYIPETFASLDDERFCFVNLDLDLYSPTISALRFFSPRMTNDGVILIHDYYSSGLDGVRIAVDEFYNEYHFEKLPIGDALSVCLIRLEKI